MGGNRLGSDPEVEKLARAARKEGFDVYSARNGHLNWVAPNGDILVSPATFKDTRRIRQIEKFLREHGVTNIRGVRARKKAS